MAANKGVSNSKTANNTDNNSAIARGDIIELNSSTINSVTATNSTTDGDDIDDDDNDERVPYTTTVARTQVCIVQSLVENLFPPPPKHYYWQEAKLPTNE